jgi:hypothetical protein
MEDAVVFDHREILGKKEELLDLCLRALSVFGLVSLLRAPEATGTRGGVERGADSALSRCPFAFSRDGMFGLKNSPRSS